MSKVREKILKKRVLVKRINDKRTLKLVRMMLLTSNMSSLGKRLNTDKAKRKALKRRRNFKKKALPTERKFQRERAKRKPRFMEL